MRRSGALCFCASLAVHCVAQSFAPPLAGIVADGRGSAQRIFGIAGNLLPETLAVGDIVITVAFSGSAGAVKTDSAVVLIGTTGAETARFPAPPGHAVFGFDPAGRPALVWFHKTQQLFAITPNGLDALPDLPPAVAALAIGAAGNVQTIAEGPALFVPTGVFSASGAALTLHRTNGSDETLGVPEPIEHLQRMGDGWVALKTATRSYALRLTSPLRLFRIPEAVQ